MYETPVPVPTECPMCGTPVRKDEGQVAIRCPNSDCPEQGEAERVEHFARIAARWISAASVSRWWGSLWTSRLVHAHSPTCMTWMRQALGKLERQGKKSIENLLKGIAESKTQPPWRFVVWAGGAAGGCVLGALRWWSISAPLMRWRRPPWKTRAEGAGTLAASWRRASMTGSARRRKCGASRPPARGGAARLPIPRRIVQPVTSVAGATWVITGTLSQGRDEVADIIRSHGGKVSSSVSRARPATSLPGRKRAANWRRRRSLV